MPVVRESIEVEAPIEDVYEAWRNFENFPEFMSQVRDVRMIEPKESVWVARVLGKRLEWRARTTEEDPPRRIAWSAGGEVGMSGGVGFSRLEPRRTRVDVEIEWKTRGLKEDVASALGIDEIAVKRDLRNFKAFVEGRRVAAGTPVR